MPRIGDKEQGLNIGNRSWGYYIYAKCPGCGAERWVASKTLEKQKVKGLCKKCFGLTRRGIAKLSLRGSKNAAWKGGRTLLKTGYIRIPMYPEDPLIGMAKHDKHNSHYWILEHRYVMAKHLGRCLESWEVVHHKNGDKTDNRIENLELLPSRQSHMAFTLLQQENESLKQRISQLEARVTILEVERVITGNEVTV